MARTNGGHSRHQTRIHLYELFITSPDGISSDIMLQVKIQRSIDSSIEQLWKFEKWMSSSV
jgi:hypothetical protein